MYGPARPFPRVGSAVASAWFSRPPAVRGPVSTGTGAPGRERGHHPEDDGQDPRRPEKTLRPCADGDVDQLDCRDGGADAVSPPWRCTWMMKSGTGAASSARRSPHTHVHAHQAQHHPPGPRRRRPRRGPRPGLEPLAGQRRNIPLAKLSPTAGPIPDAAKMLVHRTAGRQHQQPLGSGEGHVIWTLHKS